MKDFEINTGLIYKDLCKGWKYIKNPSVVSETERRIRNILIGKKKFFLKYSPETENRLNKIILGNELKLNFISIIGLKPPQRLFKVPAAQKSTKDIFEQEKIHFENLKKFDLYRYDKDYILNKTKEKEDFNYFFALKMLLTDQMDLIDFFNYQLKVSFKNDQEAFKSYLSTLIFSFPMVIYDENLKILTEAYFKNQILDLNEFKRRIKDDSENKKNQKAETKKIEIKWTSKKKNDFVKIIYSLYYAGLINNGKGEITKIIEELNETFQVELGKSWQANHSKNKSATNNDYNNLEIFETLKKSYKEYLEKNKKNN